MARSATIIILPVVAKGGFQPPAGVDLGRQFLLPSADRRKIVEFWRAKAERDQQRVAAIMRGDDYG